MKKKLVLVVAVLLIAVSACAIFAGCVPNRPDKFIGTWLTSDKKGIVTGDMEIGMSGGKFIMKKDDKNQTIFEDKDSEFNVYTCVNGEWTAKSMTKEEAKKDQTYVTITSSLDKDNEQLKNIAEQLQKDFEANFTKTDDGWWKSNSALAAIGNLQAKVDGNALLFKIEVLGGVIGAQPETKLVLNYKISIPSEAKAALNK